jgi:hypothetical protein
MMSSIGGMIPLLCPPLSKATEIMQIPCRSGVGRSPQRLEAVLNFSGNQLRTARALLGLDQKGCGLEIVGGFASNARQGRRAPEGYGVDLVNGDAPGVIWLRKGGNAAHNTEGDRTHGQQEAS